MKAIVIYEPGGPDQLIYKEVEKPRIKPGWSLVQVKGFGINHSEIYTRKGQSPTVRFPRILGIECVGEIEETTDSQNLPKGQKIISIMGEMGRAFDGGYAEYALLPNQQIYPVETELTWEQLAAIPETGYTAYGSLKNLKIREQDKVLVRGATSGVGVAFCKMLKAAFPGIFIAGSSRSNAKTEKLKKIGFDQVVLDLDGALQTEEQFDKVLELIGPATLRDTAAHVREGGIICNTGLLGGKWTVDEFDPLGDLPVNGYLTGFHSGVVDAKRIQEMLDFVSEKNVDLSAEKVFSLPEVPAAHAYLESSGSFGKVVVVV